VAVLNEAPGDYTQILPNLLRTGIMEL